MSRGENKLNFRYLQIDEIYCFGFRASCTAQNAFQFQLNVGFKVFYQSFIAIGFQRKYFNEDFQLFFCVRALTANVESPSRI